jgi:hypothetical protein
MLFYVQGNKMHLKLLLEMVFLLRIPERGYPYTGRDPRSFNVVLFCFPFPNHA